MNERMTGRQNVSRDDQSASHPERDYDFRNLYAWKRAQDLVDVVVDIVRGLPNDRVFAVIAPQILRSATAISANIAEGHGRFSPGAYRNHLSIARGSAAETISWIDTLRRTGGIDGQQEAKLLSLCRDVMNLISRQMIELERRGATPKQLREEREIYVTEDPDF